MEEKGRKIEDSGIRERKERRQWKKRDEREKLVKEEDERVEVVRRGIKERKLWKKRDEREKVVEEG